MDLLRWNATAITIIGEVNITDATSYYLNGPIGIVLDSSDALYVADGNNARVQKFFLGASSGWTVAGNSSGFYGFTANRLKYPNDVAVGPNDNLYVVDSYNHRVQLWSVNATSGITVAGNGQHENKTSHFYFIHRK